MRPATMPHQVNTGEMPAEQTKAALRLSEAIKSAILDTALDCIVTIDREGRVVDWNPAAEKTFGYLRAEALGREMAELIIPPPMDAMHRAGLARAVATGHDAMAGRRIEITARRRNGDVFPVELAITRIVAGDRLLFTGHIRDISERKHAESVLRESQQLLASITGNISEAIFRRSLRDGLVFVNDAYMKMFGYASAGELRALPPEHLYGNPDQRKRIVSLLQSDGRLRNEEVEYRRKDGSTFWGLTNATGIREETTGKILYFDGAINDITERKQQEMLQAVQYAVTRLLAESATLAEATPEILRTVCNGLHWDLGELWRVDGRQRRLHCVDIWNAVGAPADAFATASRKTTFKSGAGLPGRVWALGEPQWIPDVTRDKNFPRAAFAAENGLHGAFGFPIRLNDEVLGVIEFFSREIRQPDGDLLAMFSAIGSQIGQFIERKLAEEDLQTLNRELEQRIEERMVELQKTQEELRRALEQEKELNLLKTNFVNLVSHEFRTPLGVIMSASEILEAYFERLRPEQRQDHLQDIRHATRQMTGLMEEVLLLGRVEAGKMECRPEHLDLAGFCRRLVDEQLSATNRKCPLELSFQNIPRRARGDEALLRHVFTKLLSNAVKYSPANHPVQFSVKRDGTDAVFEIRDSGIGIPEADQKRLFEAFHRARNVGEIPGTGLGLVIVKRCVDLHRGRIEWSSALGRGTTFFVRLKMFEAKIPGRRPPQSQRMKQKKTKIPRRGRA